MTLNSALIDRLRCTITGSRLELAEPPLVERLNAAIEAGHLTNRLGELLLRPLTDALINEDRSIVWPVYDEIVVLVPDEAVERSQLDE